MKFKILLFFAFLSAFIPTMKAQEIYNYVLNNAQRTVQSPTAGFTQTRIAQFKLKLLCHKLQTRFSTHKPTICPNSSHFFSMKY